MHILSQETWSRELSLIRDGAVLSAMEVEIFKVIRELELFWNGVIIVRGICRVPEDSIMPLYRYQRGYHREHPE